MAKLSEESLKKLTKLELIVFSINLQEKNKSIQHDVKDKVRKLKECVAKLDGELALSKNISKLLSDRLINMERQYWANAQYSRRECVEVAGIPQSVPANDLEKTFSKILEKVGTEVPAKDIDACHWVGKQGRAIVKFLRIKDCQQVLSLTATDLDENLCPYRRILWSKSEALFTLGKIHSYFISNGSVKIRLQEKGPSIPITHTVDFEKHFPALDLRTP